MNIYGVILSMHIFNTYIYVNEAAGGQTIGLKSDSPCQKSLETIVIHSTEYCSDNLEQLIPWLQRKYRPVDIYL